MFTIIDNLTVVSAVKIKYAMRYLNANFSVYIETYTDTNESIKHFNQHVNTGGNLSSSIILRRSVPLA